MWQSFNRYVARLIQAVIIGISALLLFYLSVQLLRLQAYMPLTRLEDMIFIRQQPSVLIEVGVGLLLLVALAPLLKKIPPHHLFLGCALLYLLAGYGLISHVDSVIRADAKRVFEAALAMNQGDFSSFTKQGAYLYLHPHQLGLVTLERFYLLFSSSPRFIFGVNPILVLATLGLQAAICHKLYHKGLVTNYLILLSFTFLPQFFFILFAYGAIPGAFLIVLATYFFLKDQQSHRLTWAILGILMAVFAGIVRNNYQIFLIALFILWLMAYGKTLSKRYLKLPLALLVSFFLLSKLLTFSYEMAIGQPLSPGVPKLAYVTMGLQEDPKGAVGGWWNTYNTNLLKKVGYDQTLAKEKARTDLKQALGRLASDAGYASKFFRDKFHSTWLDPTFQSIWTGPLTARGQYTHTSLLKSIYEEGTGYAVLNRLGGVWLWLVYSLAAVYWLCRSRQTAGRSLRLFEYLPFLFFIGGVLFHLIWETKSQYVPVYVSLLTQPAAYSLAYIAERLMRKVKKIGSLSTVVG
ncbi:beta-carotene 15,15'-monooxygenase [Streptococcus sp. E24BD]|uniref:beta-carotene 15,15'-monooxygenase n=1 Tax=Streptococcus sp. E24BD TaxID=3278715 RepID=UPI00359D3A24